MHSIYSPYEEDGGVSVNKKYRAWDDEDEEEARSESYRQHRRALAEVAASRRALEPEERARENQVREHVGLSCAKTHGVLPHTAWTNLLG